MIKLRISSKQLNHGYYRRYLNRQEYVLPGLLRLLTLKDSSTEESLRGDTTLAGRSITGTLATRSKGSTGKLDPARLILSDDADDEKEEGGGVHSINKDGEDCTT